MFGFDEMFTNIGDLFSGAGDAVTGAFDGAGELLGSGAGAVSGALDNFGSVNDLFNGFGTSQGGVGTSTFGAGQGLDPVLETPTANPLVGGADLTPAGGGVPGGTTLPGDVYDPLQQMTDNAASSATGTPFGAELTPSELPINLQPVAGAATPAAGAPTSSVGKFIANPSLAAAGDVLGANANIALPAALLGYQALNQDKTLDSRGLQQQALDRANRLDARAEARQNALDSGKLPPGAQATIDAATKAAQAQIRQRYAGMGLSDSTMEAQDLQNAANAAQIKGFAVGSQLAAAGLQDTQISSRIYDELLRTAMAEDRSLSDSITRFAAAAAGGAAPQRRAA